MKKKVYITKEQYSNFICESKDFTSYLDKSDNGCDYPKDSNVANGGEVLTNDPDADGNPTTLDKITAMISRLLLYGFRGVPAYAPQLTENDGKKKELNERSEQNNNLVISTTKNGKITTGEKGVRLNTIEVRLHRMKEQLKNTKPGTSEYNAIRKKISALEQTVKRGSNMAAALNTPSLNQTQQTRECGNGRGHHDKNTIYYENN